jgi:hypothetical protein
MPTYSLSKARALRRAGRLGGRITATATADARSGQLANLNVRLPAPLVARVRAYARQRKALGRPDLAGTVAELLTAALVRKAGAR